MAAPGWVPNVHRPVAHEQGVSSTVYLNYATTLFGENWAASIIRMSSAVLANMFEGAATSRVTTASRSGTTVTLGSDYMDYIPVGTQVTISGIGAPFDGAFTTTGAGGQQITYTTAGSGAVVTFTPPRSANPVIRTAGFPVYTTIMNLGLDGGLGTPVRSSVPTGTGSTELVGGPYTAGSFYEPVQIRNNNCVISVGDVLRKADQPVIVSINGDLAASSSTQTMYNTKWAPHTTISSTSTGWTVFKTGDIIGRNLGRLRVENCRIYNAKRHGVCPGAGGEGYFSNLEVGGCQGAGFFMNGFGDSALSSSWFYGTGGPHVYVNAVVDFRIVGTYFEGSGNSSVYSDWANVDLCDCGFWGSRGPNVYADNNAFVKMTNVRLRDSGYGSSDASSFTSSGYASVAGVPSVQVHFNGAGGLIASNVVQEAALSGTGPIFHIRNGASSVLSNISHDPGLVFGSATSAATLLIDEGLGTLVGNFKGVSGSGSARPGWYYNLNAVVNGSVSSGYVTYMPFDCDLRDLAVDALYVHLTTVASAGTCWARCAVYSNGQQNAPGTLLRSSGAVDLTAGGGAAGNRTCAVSTLQLRPGARYWLAFAWTGTASTVPVLYISSRDMANVSNVGAASISYGSTSLVSPGATYSGTHAATLMVTDTIPNINSGPNIYLHAV